MLLDAPLLGCLIPDAPRPAVPTAYRYGRTRRSEIALRSGPGRMGVLILPEHGPRAGGNSGARELRFSAAIPNDSGMSLPLRRICDGGPYPSGHDLLHLPRFPHRADPVWLGPDRGAVGSVVERALSRQYHSGARPWCSASFGCAKDLRDEDGFRRQRVSGQALRRALVCR